MIVKISKTFEKDLSKIQDRKLKQAVFDIIRLVQQVPDMREIPQLKKLKSEVEFLVLDNRKDIYKRFP